VNVVSLIPARSGSKRIPRKNVKLLGDYPLLAYSIITSRLSGILSKEIWALDFCLLKTKLSGGYR